MSSAPRAAQVEVAKAQAESSRFQLEATYLTLSSNVVVTAVQEASLRGQIAATQRLLELQHQLTDNGAASAAARHRQRSGCSRPAIRGGANRADAAAAAKATGADARCPDGVARQAALRGAAGDISVGRFDAAHRPSGEPAVETRRAAAGCAPGRREYAHGLGRGRRRDRRICCRNSRSPATLVRAR